MENLNRRLKDVAARIKEMREIAGYSEAEMAEKTDITLEEYLQYERGEADFPFTFIHKCAKAFSIDMTELLEGKSARLSSYAVTRKGAGKITSKKVGIEINNLAPLFRQKLAEPYLAKYEYKAELQDKPIETTTHTGHEFD